MVIRSKREIGTYGTEICCELSFDFAFFKNLIEIDWFNQTDQLLIR